MDTIEIDLATIDSTQEYAKKNYPSFDADKLTCITAEEQTKGKGTQQRKWISPKGVNIYATFYFRLPLQTPHLTTLAQVMSSSFALVLLAAGLHPKVKWPNDVQLNEKKVSGSLCETIFEKEFVNIFLGIGINVNMEERGLSQIDQSATSLKVETKKTWDKKNLFKKITLQFSQDLEIFKQRGFEPFRMRLNEILAYKGEVVHYLEGEKEWVGTCDSLNLEGGLNLVLLGHEASHETQQASNEIQYSPVKTLTHGTLIRREKSL